MSSARQKAANAPNTETFRRLATSNRCRGPGTPSMSKTIQLPLFAPNRRHSCSSLPHACVRSMRSGSLWRLARGQVPPAAVGKCFTCRPRSMSPADRRLRQISKAPRVRYYSRLAYVQRDQRGPTRMLPLLSRCVGWVLLGMSTTGTWRRCLAFWMYVPFSI